VNFNYLQNNNEANIRRKQRAWQLNIAINEITTKKIYEETIERGNRTLLLTK
jgi:hypothetical protein